MGFNITTDDKNIMVLRKDGTSKNGKEYTLYSAKVSSKDSNGNWANVYLSLRFKKGTSLNNKAIIKINHAFPTVESYNGENKLGIFVLDFEVVEEGEQPVDNGGGFSSNNESLDWMNVGGDENLPFN